MIVRIKKLNNNAVLPTKGSCYSAGYDLYANIENPVEIRPNENIKIETGISCEIPVGYFGAIFARSGLACKEGLRPANCVGVIDSDYRGEIIVALHNDSNNIRIINNGERIAQLVIIPYLDIEFKECDELTETVRGSGGFGSTGMQ